MTDGSPEAFRDGLQHRHDWKAILRTQEAGICLLGFVCAVCIVVWFSCADTQKGTLLGAVTTHLTGGRAVGISAALGGGLPLWQAILLASLVESTVVCLFFTAFSLSFKKLISVRFLNDAMANVHRSAQTQRSRLLRWGIPGLILFVWFPFFMTGPVVGSVIGFLLGMRPWVVVGVVLSGTVLAIVSWTFILHEIVDWARTVGEFLPLMFVCILLIVVVSFRVKRYLETQQRREPRVDLELHE
ncbi:MAG: small multi-drug export protein [Lentisphaerae bacterium]|jgi:uncharacterized membrane protein|nr:small multi-drug export protein [Lentisphaerota bacterium]MBT4820842.1 small multi-drug export protein [Lentisphaerota bacterium]MBT5611408.1 small multi-drug export protein [Lentisphaerota bacterium]MBT7059636.1 small multi-drug export protein [Lentisphaerota bacterium]MBT7846865.1 small multi-drug export protein [Lentisphaerota bacterium]